MRDEQITQARLMGEVAAANKAKRAAVLERVAYLHRTGATATAIDARLHLGQGRAANVLRQLGFTPNREEL